MTAPLPDRFPAEAAALLVVDVQEKLLPLIRSGTLVVANCERLLRAALALEIPAFATEQYPKGLGPTVEALRPMLPNRPAKTTFHALGAPGITEALAQGGIAHVTLCGIEAHVCIAQTALELRTLGYRVQVPVDAVGSRAAIDRDFALRRLERAGVVVTTVEAVLFEWAGSSDHPAFRQISGLVKNFIPPVE